MYLDKGNPKVIKNIIATSFPHNRRSSFRENNMTRFCHSGSVIPGSRPVVVHYSSVAFIFNNSSNFLCGNSLRG